MVLVCVLFVLGICIFIVGMKCIRLGGDREIKSYVFVVGGVCFMFVGIFGLISIVWYIKEIIVNFLDLIVSESNKYEFGGVVYIGFIFVMLLFIFGMIFCIFWIKKYLEVWVDLVK